jgi:hypothetical protein
MKDGPKGYLFTGMAALSGFVVFAWVYGLEDSYRTTPKDFLDYCLKNKWEEIHNTGIKF